MRAYFVFANFLAWRCNAIFLVMIILFRIYHKGVLFCMHAEGEFSVFIRRRSWSRQQHIKPASVSYMMCEDGSHHSPDAKPRFWLERQPSIGTCERTLRFDIAGFLWTTVHIRSCRSEAVNFDLVLADYTTIGFLCAVLTCQSLSINLNGGQATNQAAAISNLRQKFGRLQFDAVHWTCKLWSCNDYLFKCGATKYGLR